jgi:hypothetical protein
VSEWWRCPNDPPCKHAGLFHDVEDMEGNHPTCCIDGCTCGKAGGMSEWIVGVTPTQLECSHGVVLARGTYLREMEPTGDHPDCLTALIEDEERMTGEYYADAAKNPYE